MNESYDVSFLETTQSAETEIISTDEFFNSQYANLVNFKNLVLDYQNDHSAEVPLMGINLDGKMLSAQDSYDLLRSELTYAMTDGVEYDESRTINFVDKFTGETYPLTLSNFFEKFNSVEDSLKISTMFLDQAAFDISKGTISSANDMRDRIATNLNSMSEATAAMLNSAIDDIYAYSQDPVDLFNKIKSFIGLDNSVINESPFDGSITSGLSDITGVKPIAYIASGVITEATRLGRAVADLATKAYLTPYYTVKLLYTVNKTIYKNIWSGVKWAAKKVAKKLVSTYVDPTDYQVNGSTIGYFDTVNYVDVYQANSDLLTSTQYEELLNELSERPVTVELFGNEYQVGVKDTHFVIIHRQKPIDFPSVVQTVGLLNSNDITTEYISSMIGAYTNVSGVSKNVSESQVYNLLSFGRAMANAYLNASSNIMRFFSLENSSWLTIQEDVSSGSTLQYWSSDSLKALAKTMREGLVLGDEILRGQYPTQSRGTNYITLAGTPENVTSYHYREIGSGISNLDFYELLTSSSKYDSNTGYTIISGSDATDYYSYFINGHLIAYYKSNPALYIGREYCFLIRYLYYLLCSGIKQYNIFKYYRGTSRFSSNTTIRSDSDNVRNAYRFTAAVIGVVVITVIAVKLVPLLVRFKDWRYMIASEYNTNAFNIGDVDHFTKEQRRALLLRNKKLKLLLNCTGGSRTILGATAVAGVITANDITDITNNALTGVASESDLSDLSQDVEDKFESTDSNIRDVGNSIMSVLNGTTPI